MAQRIECTITIAEENGRLHISANIPTDLEKSIAAALTAKLVQHAQETMNEILGTHSEIEAIRAH